MNSNDYAAYHGSQHVDEPRSVVSGNPFYRDATINTLHCASPAGQARSAPNRARFRACSLNSTPTRYTSSPRCRYLPT